MKNIKVTDEIKMELVKWFGYEYDEGLKYFYMNGAEDDLIKFYYYCKQNSLDVLDADEYAVLNTLFGYDIGLNNAGEINNWLWERDIETLELNADNSKELLEAVVKELKLDIKFDKFLVKNFEEYKYFIE